MKKVVCLLLILFLIGCSNEEKEPEEILNFNMEGTAKDVALKYNIVLKDIDMEFDMVYGYSNTLEFYMTDEVNNDNRLDGYLTIINYLKEISSDNKIYVTGSEDEFNTEKIDSLSKGIFFDVIINEIKYKVNLYQYNNIEFPEKTYSTYSLSFVKE